MMKNFLMILKLDIINRCGFVVSRKVAKELRNGRKIFKEAKSQRGGNGSCNDGCSKLGSF